jgi:hypothetical protein
VTVLVSSSELQALTTAAGDASVPAWARGVLLEASHDRSRGSGWRDSRLLAKLPEHVRPLCEQIADAMDALGSGEP